MKKCQWLCLVYALVTFCLCLLTVDGVRWMALAKMSSLAHIRNEENCEKLAGLVKRQRRLCRRNVELMDSVRVGALMAIDECQAQFKYRRWNCSTEDNLKLFGNVILKKGTREAAFVHAISSAGVAQAVTRACSSGQLLKCGCDQTVRGRSQEGFEWAGCSDNIAFGKAFSKVFVDARERGKKRRNRARSIMNLHNNEAGRRAVEDHMRTDCKCHGVSGSCEMMTCWRAMPAFPKVGTILKEKFDGATEVKQSSQSSRLVPLNSQFKPHTDQDLIYMESSPDFCEADRKTGSLGTHGRLCNQTSKAIDGCDLLCCGRGYVTREVKVVERCKCKFRWCCSVKCKRCERSVEEHVCL